MTVPYGPLLIVEDVPYILELLEVTLSVRGYPVVTARNGDEALARIAEQRPALILTDILMPKLDGFKLAHAVRRNPKTHDIPIIFLSATYITPEDKAFALSLGATTFLEKPVETEELLLTVAEILTRTSPPDQQPLPDEAFYQGYRQRLEDKLKHKQQQVRRSQQLLDSVPPEQRPVIETILEQTEAQVQEIEDQLRNLAKQPGGAGAPKP
jgi:CheY-like chemotaxis protein